MGDGYYYTYYQFTLVAGLLLCLAVSVGITCIYLLRLRRRDHRAFLLGIGIALNLLLSLWFVDAVFPSSVFQLISYVLYAIVATVLVLLLCKRGWLSVLVAIGLILSSVLYTIATLQGWHNRGYGEMILSIMLIAILYSIMGRETPFGVTFGLLEKIGDTMGSYVFVTDLKGEVVYCNRAVDEVALFQNLKNKSIHRLNDFFCVDVRVQKVENQNPHIAVEYQGVETFLSFTQTPIVVQGNTVGELTIFADVTKVVELTKTLQRQKQESMLLYAKLKNYSKVVYHVERERATQLLLNQVIAEQSDAMERLCLEIHKLTACMDSPDFSSAVEEVLEMNFQILEEIRSTVSTYKQLPLGGMI